ncbi:MAG TPA: BatD family protein [Bacteroidales bacterium]|nr:BatD family protein [Bacteroidales bacterium]
MKLKKRILFYTILSLCTVVSGQDISVTADYPEVVRVGQQFSISWTVNTGGGEFLAPSFEGFYKLMGPQTSYSSSTQIINGKMTRETSYSYVYYLQAVKEGKFVLSPATFTLKSKTYSSDSLRIEVIGTGTSQQNAAGAITRDDKDQVQTSGDDIFINLSLSRKEVYMGEHIVATVKIYAKVDISGINEVKFPAFNGFLKADLNTPPLTSLQRDNIDGTIYATGVVQQFLLYPQISGEITVEPVQISVLVRQKTGQADPFFGDFFSTYTTIPRAVISRAVNVRVKPLPGVKPDDYSGVVGKLDLKASLSKDSVTVNDAITLKIILSGNGNLKLAAVPKLNLPPDIEVYDPKISDDLKSSLNGTTGQKVFEYLLIPRHYGDYKIPPVTYSYFNAASGQYEKLTTDEYRFHARKGSEQNTGITVYGGISKEDVKYVGKDIRFIESEPDKLRKTGDILLSKRSFNSIYGFAFLIFLLVLFARREHVRRNSDLTIVRNRKAAKVAKRRLTEASRCLKSGLIDKFYEEMLKAIWGYLSDKLNIPVSDLTRNSAINSLKEEGIEEEKINNLITILDTCEYARFAPSSSDTEAAAIYEGASQFIRTIENSVS